MTPPYRDIIERQITEAASLWQHRSVVVDQPQHSPETLAKLEQRIDRCLAALFQQPELAWELCVEALVLAEPGETFTAAQVAFASDNTEKIQQVLKAGMSHAETFKGLVSALGWLAEGKGHSWVQAGLASDDRDHNHLAIAACGILPHDPGDQLPRLLKRAERQPADPLLMRCLRLVGELKRTDLIAAANQAVTADNANVRFWGIWSSVMLGDHACALKLDAYVHQANPWQQKAIQLAFRILPDGVADSWIAQLLDHPGQQRLGVKAIAANGRIHAVPGLIAMMKDEALARAAGEAFSQLTGIDLEPSQLVRPAPPLNDDPDDIHAALEDAALPWPDPDKVAARWQQRGGDFDPGQRYFMGQPLGEAHLGEVLASGYQRQRHAASLQLALLEPSRPLSNTRAIHR